MRTFFRLGSVQLSSVQFSWAWYIFYVLSILLCLLFSFYSLLFYVADAYHHYVSLFPNVFIDYFISTTFERVFCLCWRNASTMWENVSSIKLWNGPLFGPDGCVQNCKCSNMKREIKFKMNVQKEAGERDCVVWSVDQHFIIIKTQMMCSYRNHGKWKWLNWVFVAFGKIIRNAFLVGRMTSL